MEKTAKRKFTITYGGWYQRTTLHLSEIYDLFAHAKGKHGLSKQILKEFHDQLNLQSVSREAAYLELVKAVTKDNIEIRYYEDGLYILQIQSDDIEQSKQKLSDFYNNHFNPAINYLFSLGAPTPKILANITTVHPTVVALKQQNHTHYPLDQKRYGYLYSKITTKEVTVYKTPGYIFIFYDRLDCESIDALIGIQIFFREFKDQLDKYLDIHRKIWEEISSIKEKKQIKGKEVEKIRSELDSYQKTVNLIRNRINQMSSYINTRASISRDLEIEDYLIKLFQYKFEVLLNTLEYIKEIWQMTTDYLTTAIQIIVEIKNQSTDVSIKSLRLITALGVVAGIVGYLSKDTFPRITGIGILFFVILLLATWMLDRAVVAIYKNIKYKLQFAKEKRNL